MKYWEIIADNLSKAGWSLGCASALDCEGRTIWIVDTHRDNGKRFVVHADEKLTAFLEPESVIKTGRYNRSAQERSPDARGPVYRPYFRIAVISGSSHTLWLPDLPFDGNGG